MPNDEVTFVTWMKDEPIVYVVFMQKDLVRQLRVSVRGRRVKGVEYAVEALEIVPEGSQAITEAMGDRNLVQLLMELGVTPQDRLEILETLVVP